MALFGGLILVGVVFSNNSKIKLLLFALGIVEVLAAVTSWSGVMTWNVPFSDKAIFNVSMSFLDFAGAIALFVKALNVKILMFSHNTNE